MIPKFRSRREREALKREGELIDAEGQRTALFRAVFGSPEGQKVLHDLYAFAGLTKPCYHDTDRGTAFALGRRLVALYIQETISGKRIPKRRVDTAAGTDTAAE